MRERALGILNYYQREMYSKLVFGFLPREWLSVYASRFGQFSETAGGFDSCGFEAPCGEGSGAYVHPFSFVISLFFLPSPLLFYLLSWSSPIVFSPADSHSRNSFLGFSGLCYSSVHWEYIVITLANSLSKFGSFGLLIFQWRNIL